jgi:anthranilate synthase component I
MTAPRLADGEVLPLSRRLTGCPDPLALFAQLTDGGRRPDTILLESADGATGRDARSILVVRAALRLTCRGREVEVSALTPNGEALLPWLASRAGAAAHVRPVARGFTASYAAPGGRDLPDDERVRRASPLDLLRLAVTEARVVTEPAPFSHFAAATLSYDLIDLFEDLPAPRDAGADWPTFEAWVPDRVIVVDHGQRATTVLASVLGGAEAAANYHDAVRAVESLTASVAAAPEAPGWGEPVAPPAAPAAAATADLSDEAYAAMVRTLQGHIAAGDIFQAVPSRTFTLPCRDPLAAYIRLRRSNPSPYMFYLRSGAGTLFGASPETCVRVAGVPRAVTLRPIAGTIRRSRLPDGRRDPEGDARSEVALRTDAKELAEHLMLVDLARNDVARISRPGTRRVTRLLDVDRFSHVLHLVSEVTGELAPGCDALHAYAASMNMGTVVGAPKLRAAELLRGLERTARGAYGGAVGYLTHGGELDTALVIRAAVVRDGIAAVRAGAGVVAASDPDREALETRHKAAAVLDAVAGSEVAHE